MGLFEHFPYTNFHELNLDWVIEQVKKLGEQVKNAVVSINGKTGEVTLTAADVGALPDTYAPPVRSVNGKVGVVQLDAEDVGAASSVYIATLDGPVDNSEAQKQQRVRDFVSQGAEFAVGAYGDTENLAFYNLYADGMVQVIYAPATSESSVLSVNGQTGAVNLTAADVGAKPANYSAPVASVNGKTGAVNLTAADVGAKPASYSAPVASVNGKTGAVHLSAADVGAKDESYTAPVESVNGQTGAVQLSASDVGAKDASYTAPVESVNELTGEVVITAVDLGAAEGGNFDNLTPSWHPQRKGVFYGSTSAASQGFPITYSPITCFCAYPGRSVEIIFGPSSIAYRRETNTTTWEGWKNVSSSNLATSAM